MKDKTTEEIKKKQHRAKVLLKKMAKTRTQLERTTSYLGFLKKTLWDGSDPEFYKLLTSVETTLLGCQLILQLDKAPKQIAEHVGIEEEEGGVQ